MIRFEQVTKRYPDGTTAVDDLSFEVAEGELVTLVGPSGCGKTTTMMMVNRLIEPTSGRISVDGEDIAAVDPVRLRRRIGYVIQQVGLFPHRTVLDNTATVPALLGWKRAKARARAAELLDLVGLDPKTYGPRYPEQLSGGQRQRVGVARALAADPPVLLMDEPFGAVDPVVREQLQDEFLRMQAAVRKTVLLVTHDIEEAVRLGDRIAVYGQGRIEQFDTPGRCWGARHAVRRLVRGRGPGSEAALGDRDRAGRSPAAAGGPAGRARRAGAAAAERAGRALGGGAGRAGRSARLGRGGGPRRGWHGRGVRPPDDRVGAGRGAAEAGVRGDAPARRRVGRGP